MQNQEFRKKIENYLYIYEHPSRLALSKKYPKLQKPIIFVRHLLRNIQNFFDWRLQTIKSVKYFENIIVRHQSLLRRKLGVSDPRLQEQKIINLRQAIKKLDGVIIPPRKIFSLWKIIGKPKYKTGYVDGMLLSGGEVSEGLGGGLCQLSNFLYWILLHAQTKIIERHHHSKDVFPDSSRTLPFGSGATIFYNFVDLKVKNVSKFSLQIKIWLTNEHLKGQILSSGKIVEKIHIFEKNHLFIKKGNKYFRYNEIFREIQIDGKVVKTEEVTTNFAPVIYKVDKEYLQKNNFEVWDYTRLH
ncbi:MAG: vancomycin resistance protein [Candidatus Magasanikbacteria bacterium CG_4_10_14_0_8_um_filter_32_14]|uniref:Vancomycin resistance protein n=1 Tax=Candidatus Magasanikbacteria bacterium CG_4_10_14_0_8_um_filter_32_14 TaxID=1974640 RepID=A0A2M7R9G8_9BACT|nr:MAG: vancomycin resistance protein [Candidatus Magasanikbacteria bacterium CG_4_10_14_0_8_um_filter_32_14]